MKIVNITLLTVLISLNCSKGVNDSLPQTITHDHSNQSQYIDHVHDPHTHDIEDHSHGDHTHELEDHNHPLPAHNHSLINHVHSPRSHTHDVHAKKDHTHDVVRENFITYYPGTTNKRTETSYYASTSLRKLHSVYKEDGITLSAKIGYYESTSAQSYQIFYDDNGIQRAVLCFASYSYEYSFEDGVPCNSVIHGLPSPDVVYYSDGKSKKSETIYNDTSGGIEKIISYHENGNLLGYTCYSTNGRSKVCNSKTDGSPSPLVVYHSDGVSKSTETIYNDSTGYRLTSTSYQSDGITKTRESTHFTSNGFTKTSVVYQSDGINKRSESTYFESTGRLNTSIQYYQDGSKQTERTNYNNITNTRKTEIFYQRGGIKNSGYPICYDITYAREACTQSKHGCTSESTTCIPSE